MLTVEELASLKVGDCVETYALMKGLTPEPVVLRVMETAQAESADPVVVMMATWLGITLGRWTASVKENAVNWSMA